jgi:hypothetical protein
MEYLLTGLGCALRSPAVARVRVATRDDAVREAERMLASNRDCVSVEIFCRGHFLGEISRRGAAADDALETVLEVAVGG